MKRKSMEEAHECTLNTTVIYTKISLDLSKKIFHCTSILHYLLEFDISLQVIDIMAH
jgi:hypothetical protein